MHLSGMLNFLHYTFIKQWHTKASGKHIMNKLSCFFYKPVFPLMTCSWNTFLSLFLSSIYDNCRAPVPWTVRLGNTQHIENLCWQTMGKIPNNQTTAFFSALMSSTLTHILLLGAGLPYPWSGPCPLGDLLLLKLSRSIPKFLSTGSHISHLFALTTLVFQVPYNAYCTIS